MNSYGQERRRFPRANFPCKITIYLPKEHTIVTHTESISCGGIEVKVKENLTVLSIVGLELFLDKNKVIQCKGRVVWRLADKGGVSDEELVFDIGLEFVDITHDDMVIIEEVVDDILRRESC